MNDNGNWHVRFIAGGVICEGCTLVDEIKNEYLPITIIKFKPDEDGFKYCCMIGYEDESPFFKTKEEAYKYALKVCLEFLYEHHNKLEKIRNIMDE